MEDVDRRSTIVLGLAAASAFVFAGSGVAEAAVGDETEPAKGVKIKILGEGPAMVPGFKTVRLRDVIVQPGSSNPASAMKNPMVCHITEGELQVTQDGKPFTAKKNFVWTCNTGTMEGVANKGSVVAVMRITDLLTA
jgi:quercetin dioxygenase-like cupin family protein